MQTAVAPFTINSRKKKNHNQETASRFTFKCHNCGQASHRRNVKKQNEEIQRNRETQNMQMWQQKITKKVLFSAVTEAASFELTTWILDSEVSEHLVNNAIYYQIKDLCLNLLKYGWQNLGKIDVNDNTILILYVPSIQFNFLFMPKLEIKGYKILFEKEKNTI